MATGKLMRERLFWLREELRGARHYLAVGDDASCRVCYCKCGCHLDSCLYCCEDYCPECDSPCLCPGNTGGEFDDDD